MVMSLLWVRKKGEHDRPPPLFFMLMPPGKGHAYMGSVGRMSIKMGLGGVKAQGGGIGRVHVFL